MSYNLNGGSGAIPEGKTDDPGFKVNLAAIDGITAPAKKLFAGWATDAAGTKLLQPGDPLTINADTVLYAIWADTATATFVNPGDDLSDLNETVAAGTEITMPSGNGLLKPSVEQDMSFYGWKTEGQTANTETETGYYVPGKKVTLDADTEFTAVWGPSKLKIIVNKNYYYHDVVAKEYKLYETETDVLKEHVTGYTVAAKDYPDNVMQLNSDAPQCDAEGAVFADGTFTFDTTNAKMSDAYNGVVNVDFYYDAYYTLSHRSDAYLGYKEYEPGITGVYQYGDAVLGKNEDEIYPVGDRTITYDTHIAKTYYDMGSVGAYKDGYADPKNEPVSQEYINYGEESINDLGGEQPLPGATIIYRYSLMPATDFTQIVYDQRYLNAFNNDFKDPRQWEFMRHDTFNVAVHFGETVTYNLWRTSMNSYPAGDSSLNPIGFYKDSGFDLWLYSTQPNWEPNNKTLTEITTATHIRDKGIPLVVTGTTKGDHTRLELLYKGSKQVYYTVKYFVDGVQVYETFNVHAYYNSTGEKHTVQSLPDDATSDAWTYECFDAETGEVKTQSSTENVSIYANVVKTKPGDEFGLIDVNIEY